MKYTDYIVEDFVLDDSFRNYVLQKNKEDMEFWSNWIEEHPEMKPVIEEAKKIIEGLDFNEVEVSKKEIDEQFQEISEYFDRAFENNEKSRNLSFRSVLKIAASILIIVFAGFGAFKYMNNNQDKLAKTTKEVTELEKIKENNEPTKEIAPEKEAAKIARKKEKSPVLEVPKTRISESSITGIEDDKKTSNISNLKRYATMQGEKEKILLPDGSVVYMNENSNLRFRNNWKEQNERIVHLEGEAYFHVKEITNRKGKLRFSVITTDVTVEVLGTKFNVNQKGNKTKVFLSSGKVQMSIPGKNQTIKMNPGEMVEYNLVTGNIKSSHTDQAQYKSWLSAFDLASNRVKEPENMTAKNNIHEQSTSKNNESKVLQNGEQNSAFIEQIGENLRSKQVQQGQNNKAEAVISGESSKDQSDELSWSTWQVQKGQENVSIFRLTKSYNSNIYSAQVGKRNKAHVQSKGNNNRGLILQYGEDNRIRIRQDGNQNSVLILQKGSESEFKLSPEINGGHYNKVNIIQKGNNNRSKAVQSGKNNTINVDQR